VNDAYDIDPRAHWHPAMRLAPWELMKLTPAELDLARAHAEAMTGAGGLLG
jgi:hypothetical protein